MRASEAELARERELVEAAKTRREEFGRLYDHYFPRIYRYAYRQTGSHPEAEDLTAETFRRALEHLDGYHWQGHPFGAWLFRIAANLVVSRHRQARPQGRLDESFELADGDPLPEEAALAREEVGALWNLVATLPPDQRRAVVLRFGHGLKGREIAAKLGRSEGAAKQLLYRAMLTLREQVESGCRDDRQPHG